MIDMNETWLKSLYLQYVLMNMLGLVEICSKKHHRSTEFSSGNIMLYSHGMLRHTGSDDGILIYPRSI